MSSYFFFCYYLKIWNRKKTKKNKQKTQLVLVDQDGACTMSHGFPNKYACCVETLLERRKEIDSFKVARFKPNSQRNLQPKNCKFTVTFQKFPHHLIGWCQRFRFRCCRDGSKRLAEGLTHIEYTWTLVCVSSWGKIDVQINEMI